MQSVSPYKGQRSIKLASIQDINLSNYLTNSAKRRGATNSQEHKFVG